jgi:hypothetical protein
MAEHFPLFTRNETKPTEMQKSLPRYPMSEIPESENDLPDVRSLRSEAARSNCALKKTFVDTVRMGGQGDSFF